MRTNHFESDKCLTLYLNISHKLMWRWVEREVGLWGLSTSKAIHQQQYTGDITAQIKAIYYLIFSSNKGMAKESSQ